MHKLDKVLYLDNAATSLVNEEVIKEYTKALSFYVANPSSIHGLGQLASHELEITRLKIASLLKLDKTHEVIFTSGATEANNIALLGYARKYRNRGNHIIVSSIEHPSILLTAKALESEGFEVSYLPVNEEGKVSLTSLKEAIREDTILVSIMGVNNEVGAINPIEEIASFLKNYPKICFHCDAVQALAKVNINYKDVDLITFSPHKIGGLIGGGLLLKRKNLSLNSIVYGGGQENNLRSGTNDLPMAKAILKCLEIALKDQNENYKKVEVLYNYIFNYLSANSDKYHISVINGSPYILNFSLVNKKAAVMVEALSNYNIMVSSISACHSKNEASSYVVKAITHDDYLANNTIRLSFNPDITISDLETFVQYLSDIEKEMKQ